MYYVLPMCHIVLSCCLMSILKFVCDTSGSHKGQQRPPLEWCFSIFEATPGNHDYWFNGIPNTGANWWLWGYDQFANGHAQFFAQDLRLHQKEFSGTTRLFSWTNAGSKKNKRVLFLIFLTVKIWSPPNPKNLGHYKFQAFSISVSKGVPLVKLSHSNFKQEVAKSKLS